MCARQGVKVLIVGLSTRAIAESAVGAGHQVMTVDYFGDRDQKESVPNISLMRDLGSPFSALALGQACGDLAADKVVPIANLENHPEVVRKLARGRTLMGNPPSVLAKVRDWETLRSFCAEVGIAFPATLLAGEESGATLDRRWLVKPVRGGGGHGVRFWQQGEPLGEGYLLQAYQPGRPASAAFVADGRRCVVVGLAEQLLGQPTMGAHGFSWCGNLLPLALPAEQVARVLADIRHIASLLTGRFALRGLNGIDFVLPSDGPLHLIEVNPRYTASMELVERAYGLSLFDLHLGACEGVLPTFDLGGVTREQRTWGKGIVFARRSVTIPETADWFERGRRDIPFPGDRIDAGHPVCTLLVEGKGRDDCWQHLLSGASALRHEIGDELGGVC